MEVQTKVRIPKGIKISEPVESIGPEIETYSDPNGLNAVVSCDLSPWSYLSLHNSKVPAFTARLSADGIRYFIHKSVTYHRNRQSRGIHAVEKPTVSGLVFLQGDSPSLQDYLDINFPGYHLVNNCSTHLPTVIPDRVMQPFMRVLDVSPERVRFLLHPFRYYADGNVKLRLTSGLFSGLEGYVVRIDRDRRLVLDVGGMSVAVSGVHCETFEVVEEKSTESSQIQPEKE